MDTRIALETYYQKGIGSSGMFGFEFSFLSFSFEWKAKSYY